MKPAHFSLDLHVKMSSWGFTVCHHPNSLVRTHARTHTYTDIPGQEVGKVGVHLVERLPCCALLFCGTSMCYQRDFHACGTKLKGGSISLQGGIATTPAQSAASSHSALSLQLSDEAGIN